MIAIKVYFSCGVRFRSFQPFSLYRCSSPYFQHCENSSFVDSETLNLFQEITVRARRSKRGLGERGIHRGICMRILNSEFNSQRFQASQLVAFCHLFSFMLLCVFELLISSMARTLNIPALRINSFLPEEELKFCKVS